MRALEHTKGNKRRAMELLQLSPETFYRRLEEFGLHKKSRIAVRSVPEHLFGGRTPAPVPLPVSPWKYRGIRARRAVAPALL